MCAVRVGLFTAVSYEYWLMAVVVGFHCDKEPAKLRSSPGKRPLSRRLVSSVKCIWRWRDRHLHNSEHYSVSPHLYNPLNTLEVFAQTRVDARIVSVPCGGLRHDASCFGDSDATLRILWARNGFLMTRWRCWLGGRKDTRPVKNWVVRCWRGYLSGARCRLAYGPADATATHCLLLQ